MEVASGSGITRRRQQMGRSMQSPAACGGQKLSDVCRHAGTNNEVAGQHQRTLPPPAAGVTGLHWFIPATLVAALFPTNMS